jgi:hypothetical protein
MIAVTYEQHIGRRVPGQDGAGEFSVSTSKTRAGTMDETIKRWIEVVSEREEFSGVAISRGPEVSRTDKWRYWRCGPADGFRVVVDVTDMTPAKSVISVPHEKFASPTTAIGTGRITERSRTERGGNSSSPECHCEFRVFKLHTSFTPVSGASRKARAVQHVRCDEIC